MLILILSGILIALILLLLSQYLWDQRKRPPGPCGLPLIGNLLSLHPTAPHKVLQNWAIKYGPIYEVRLGNVRTVVLADASLVRECLRRNELTARAPLYITHGIMGGYGLICAEGQLWKDQRRQTIDWLKRLGMTKKLSPSRRQLEKRICVGVNEFLRVCETNSKLGCAFDPMPALHHTLGNVINELVFGIKYPSDDPTWQYLKTLQEEGLKIIGVSGVVNFLPVLRFLPFVRKNIRFLLDGKAKTHEIYDQIITDCQRRLKQRKLDGVNNTEQFEYHSILECFLDERESRQKSEDSTIRATAENFYGMKQLRHLLADLFGASLDTSLATLRWIILYLAKYPDCQARLRKFLTDLPIGDTSLDDLESIDYLKACISEAQRIRSVVPLGLPHGVVSDTELNGINIPANTMVLPLLWEIHMNPSVWPNPDKYDPARFLDEQGVYYQPQQFIPFQTGKRICPGEDLARMFLQLYVGNIFRHYEIQLSPESHNISMEGECGFTLSASPYKLLVRSVTV